MDEKRLSLPLILISPAFFSFWLFLFAGFVADLVPGPKMVFFPESGFMYSFNGTFLFALLMLLPFAGSILLIANWRDNHISGRQHSPSVSRPVQSQFPLYSTHFTSLPVRR